MFTELASNEHIETIQRHIQAIMTKNIYNIHTFPSNKFSNAL
mgnify:CR=1 FL=1